ncbi:hypothetical protein NP233_g273 [Leucocoprinus birnbaumii]|uniref:Uncharacterized protein n=1 Tax=Leucocoprinus birnbaumii TaxID=56174 RepID=A0AAD5W4G6_9AGAR|nr:hypothetical protein NP233_g273 [Leucocoprinus birnbaumii]
MFLSVPRVRRLGALFQLVKANVAPGTSTTTIAYFGKTKSDEWKLTCGLGSHQTIQDKGDARIASLLPFGVNIATISSSSGISSIKSTFTTVASTAG